MYRYLTKKEYQIVERLFEVIIPSDKEPGAIEANCANFLDNLLSNPTMYWEIPFWRQQWRLGIRMIDQISIDKYSSSFADLPLSTRFIIVSELSQGKLKPWQSGNRISLEQSLFFEMIRVHAIQGLLSDPIYGGNKNRVGWKLFGFEIKSESSMKY